jgi:uncharacterized protein (DUF1800 family)
MISIVLFTSLQSVAQEIIILGAGSEQPIEVLTSSDYQPAQWDYTADGRKTIDGNGLEGKIVDASRFLSQATFGADLELIDQVVAIGIEEWLDMQIAMPVTSMLQEMHDTYDEVVEWNLMNGVDSSDISFVHPYWNNFNYAWWTLNMTNEDKLRQRVAYALSQIMVISVNSDLSSHSYGLSSYYDVLAGNALGNYRDLLMGVTLHPCMGFYLSHLNNPRADEEENVHPDENYAREIQQLFSIGLYELNEDGSRKLDNEGNEIATYGQNEIKEFAKVFTGLSVSGVIPNMYIDSAEFGVGIYLGDLTKPMKMYENWHEPGEKKLLNGFVIPDGQIGMEDIEDAIDNLVNHPNVGPFLGRRLIQQLVTSNPSPEYIARISRVFADNGSGVRGDLGAVVRAILMDPEARTCEALSKPEHGKLREPFVRYAHFASAMDVEQFYGRYWNVGWGFYQSTGQVPMAAIHVFNFYLPDYKPLGPISDAGLVAPEFQIHNSRTGVSYLNEVNTWAVWNSVMSSWEPDDPNAVINIDELKSLAADPEVLVNRLDVLFTHGMLSDRTRGVIKNAIEPLMYGEFRDDRVRMALYLIMISPDYNILK